VSPVLITATVFRFVTYKFGALIQRSKIASPGGWHGLVYYKISFIQDYLYRNL